jgi:hypothetical protein
MRRYPLARRRRARYSSDGRDDATDSNHSYDSTFTTAAGVIFVRRPDAIHRSGSPLTARTIPESTIAALRELLLHMIRVEPESDAEGVAHADENVRGALRNLCDDARRNHVRVEQLVIAIKQGWSLLHSERPRARSAGPDELLNQLITLCIDEYYVRAERK